MFLIFRFTNRIAYAPQGEQEEGEGTANPYNADDSFPPPPPLEPSSSPRTSPDKVSSICMFFSLSSFHISLQTICRNFLSI